MEQGLAFMQYPHPHTTFMKLDQSSSGATLSFRTCISCARALDSSRALVLASPAARNVSMLAACCARAL